MADAAKETPKAEGDVEMKAAEEAAKDAEMKAEEEPAKDAAAEEKPEEKQEAAPKEPEKPKELEEDASEDGRARLASSVAFHAEDTTLNAVPAADGKLLLTLPEGGFQYLVAAARASVGVKAGRYMFEAVMLGEQRPAQQQAQQRQPQQAVRLGFSTAGSSLFLGDGEDSVCFDAEGVFVHGKTKKRVSQRVGAEQVLAVLLNLDAGSPNANTVSVFRNGVRLTQPQPLPERLRGKTLFPTFNVRGTSLRLNMSEPPMQALPFSCRMLRDAAAADCEVAEHVVPADGKFEVVVPVALPDEGGFDWVDQFLAKNPRHLELSTRALIDWAEKSGVWRKSPGKGSNDRPEPNFGVPQLDDLGALLRLVASVATALPRNYVVPDIRSNLMAESRKAIVEKFAGFKKTANVLVGEPAEGFKEGVRASLLQEKRAKAEAEAKRKKAEAERKKLLEAKRKQVKAAAASAAGKEEGGDGEEKKEEDEKVEVEEEEVNVELTDEEKKLVFRNRPLPDVLAVELAKAFTKFSLPAQDEGFDDVRFEWQAAAAASEYLREWVLKRKATQRVEDLQPGKWFRDAWGEWQKTLLDWKKKQTEWKKVIDQLQEWKKEGKKKTPEAKPAEESGGEKKEGEEKHTEIDAEDLDPLRVENVCDVGTGEPLFANFDYEDWCLLSLRYELHMLVHAFRRDMDDTERATFHESHLTFYFSRYYKKTLDLKTYNVGSNKELVDMIKDTMVVGADGMLEGQHGEDAPADSFVKLAEEHRRDRQRRLDAGDESAELKFAKPVPARMAPQVASQWQKTGQRPPFMPAQRVAGLQAVQKVAQTPQQPRYAPTAQAAAGSVKLPFQAAPRAGVVQPRIPPGTPVAGLKRPYTPAPKAVIQPPKQARTTYAAPRW